MASTKSTVDHLVAQMEPAGAVSARAMFGEYAIYCDGKLVALVCDDQLFLKPVPAAEAAVGAHEKGPPYPGAKPHIIVPEDRWGDRAWMSLIIRKTAEALPAPKPKKTTAKRKK